MIISEQKDLKFEAVVAGEFDYLRWVAPFYLDFLHHNFTITSKIYSVASPHRRSWEAWSALLRREQRGVTPELVGDLIMDSDWRPQICGAYFCGFNRWDDFTLDIGNRLVTKRNGLVTQGYAFALARMPSHAAANYLCGYLSRVDRPEDSTHWYGDDVEWVIAALQWVDAKMDTNRLAPYKDRLVPIWHKRRFENLKRQYREAPSLLPRSECASLEKEKKRLLTEAVERTSVDVDKQLDTYFSFEENRWQNQWFCDLMEFCELHFDSLQLE